MKKILLGVAVAVAAVMMTGCNLGLGNSNLLIGNKWGGEYPVDGTNISGNYKRVYEQFGSPNANFEKVQAITTRITVKKDGAILKGDYNDAVWGFIFDLDRNGELVGEDKASDFCCIGFKADSTDGSRIKYYMERYIQVLPKDLKDGIMDQGSLGAYFTMTGGEANKLYECDLLPGGTAEVSCGNKPNHYTDSATEISGVNDWEVVETNYYTASTEDHFDAYLHIRQDIPGKYEVFLSKTEEKSTTEKKLGEFGIATSVTDFADNGANYAKEKGGVDTQITGYKRMGPVFKGNKGQKQTEDSKNKYYLAGGIAAYASAPKGSKLTVTYKNIKESLRGELFAQPVE